jgi:hypothetical protein
MPMDKYEKQDTDPTVEMGDIVKALDIDGEDLGWDQQIIAIYGGAPKQVRDILRHHMPIWLDLFQMKSREYGDAAFELGARAQFVDMNRKMVKLRQAIWEGREDALTTESVEEILLDLIGHCFLTLEMRRRERPNPS